MRVMFCTVPADRAPELARKLVEARLVACVNVVPGVRSFYWWEGEVQDDGEALMIMKTTDEGAARVLRELPDMHPYDVPEILTLDVLSGHDPYVRWVEEETRAS